MKRPAARIQTQAWNKITPRSCRLAGLIALVLLACLCPGLYAQAAPDNRTGVISIKLSYPEAMTSAARVKAVQQAFDLENIYNALEGIKTFANILEALDAIAMARLTREEAVLLGEQNLAPTDPARIRLTLDLAQDYIRTRAYDQAVRTAQAALGTLKEAGRSNPDPELTWLSMTIIGRGLFGQGKYDLSINFYEMALKLAALDENNHTWATLWILASMEHVYARAGKKGQAADIRKRYLADFNNLFNSSREKSWPNIRHMARAFSSHGDYSMAQSLYEMIYPHTARLHGPTHPFTVGTLMQLYHVYFRQANYKRAKDTLNKLAAGQKDELGLSHPDTIMTLNLLAGVNTKLKHTTAARQIYDQTLPYLDRYFDHQDPYYSYFMYRAAELHYTTTKDYDKTKALLEESLPPMIELYGAQSPFLLDPLQLMAGACYSLGLYEQASKYHQMILPILEQVRGPDDPETLRLLDMMEKTYTALGQTDNAGEIRRKIEALRKGK